MPLWIRDPLAIMADAGGGVVVDGNHITELVPTGRRPQTPGCEVFDASRHVLLPGLVNTHHHFFQTLTRAFPAALDKELFPWLRALYPVWERISADMMRAAARVAMGELLLSGCTTASDHHYLFAADLFDTVDIEVEVARELGMRVVLSRGSMNLRDDKVGFPPVSLVETEEAILDHTEALLKRYHQRGAGAMVQIAVAPNSPFEVTPQLMRESASLARRYRAPLHTHLAETRDEIDYCLRAFDCRMVDYLDEVDWLRRDVWLAHGIHFDRDEIARLGTAGLGVAHCPSSNALLGSGCCPVHGLESAGCHVGLGVDGSASNDGSNMIQEVRQAFLTQRLMHGPKDISHLDALRWATEGGARCLMRPDIGRISVGACADLALFTLDEMRFWGSGDPIAALVLCGAHRADRVMVNGRWVVEDGQLLGLDMHDLRKQHLAASSALLEFGGA